MGGLIKYGYEELWMESAVPSGLQAEHSLLATLDTSPLKPLVSSHKFI